MKPIKFEGSNVTYAEGLPEYEPLPAHRDEAGVVTTCWELTPEETLEIFNTGRIWIRQLSFNQPLQPINPSVEKPL